MANMEIQLSAPDGDIWPASCSCRLNPQRIIPLCRRKVFVGLRTGLQTVGDVGGGFESSRMASEVKRIITDTFCENDALQ
jgi:hypothetical protein